MRILLIDDDEDSRESVAEFLLELGHVVVQCDSGEHAIERFADNPFPLVITDLCLPGLSGIDLLERLDFRKSGSEVIVITGHGDIESAVSALRLGAYDYLQKPINVNELAVIVDKVSEYCELVNENRELSRRFEERLEAATARMRHELSRAKSALSKHGIVDRVVTGSQIMETVVETALKFHGDPLIPVLIEGETGCGKEVVARLIHFGEGGLNTPFVDINCSALVDQLFESEFFGYDEGAFTGAKANGKPGKLEMAESGTLMLDEISELSLRMQPKLLRLLENRSYFRVGGLTAKQFGGRFICNSNKSLSEMVKAGSFRMDLFHRLFVGYLYIPPLRERLSEIVPLADYFLKREADRRRRRFVEIDPRTIEMFRQYHWPGNIRELEHVIERAVLLYDDERLKPEHISFQSATMPDNKASLTELTWPSADAHEVTLPEGPLDLEKWNLHIIRRALDRFNGNKTRTARYLGMTRRALDSRVRKLG